MNVATDVRVRMIEASGARGREIEELLEYNRNLFDAPEDKSNLDSYPLADEPFVADWDRYAAEVSAAGSIEVMSAYLRQFWFPVAAGISQTAEYQLATLQGANPGSFNRATGLKFVAAERCRLVIHRTPAGRIPIFIADTRQDFITLVRALSHRNEPVPVPDSMGAAVVGSFNNWDRIVRLRDAFFEKNPEASEAHWRLHMRASIVPRKELYQDRFIILGPGPYSGVPAEVIGLARNEWLKRSTLIRCEHESAHYFTRRVLGSMKNRLLDELIADYYGFFGGAGGFKAEWFLRCMGLENFPVYREGGRMQNYRGNPPLSTGAFLALQWMVREAAMNLEKFYEETRTSVDTDQRRAALLLSLAAFTLEEMAAPEGPSWLCHEFFRRVNSKTTRR